MLGTGIDAKEKVIGSDRVEIFFSTGPKLKPYYAAQALGKIGPRQDANQGARGSSGGRGLARSGTALPMPWPKWAPPPRRSSRSDSEPDGAGSWGSVTISRSRGPGADRSRGSMLPLASAGHSAIRDVRCLVIKSLVEIGEAAVRPLVGSTQGDEPASSENALPKPWARRPRRLCQPLVDALNDDNHRVRLAVVEALRAIGINSAAVPSLIKMLSESPMRLASLVPLCGGSDHPPRASSPNLKSLT